MQVENVLDETRKPPAEDRFRFRRGLGAFCDGFASASVAFHEVAACQRAVVVDFSAEDGEARAFAVVLDGRHGFQCFHVCVRDDEAVDVSVVFHMCGVRRLWQRQRAELQAVADAELGDGDAVFFRHRLKLGVLQDGAVVVEDAKVPAGVSEYIVTLTGKGTKEYDIYVDGEKFVTQKVAFNGN